MSTRSRVRVCYVGGENQLYRFGILGQLLEGETAEEESGRRWWWEVPSLSRSTQSDFVVAEGPGWARFLYTKRRSPEAAAFLLPYFVRADCDVGNEYRLLTRNRSLQEDIRKIRKAGFEYEITSDPQALGEFFEKHHLPFVESSHGQFMITRNHYGQTGEEAGHPSNLQLLKVLIAGQWVSGCTFDSSKTEFRMLELGVYKASRSLVRKGAGAAAYWFCMKHAAERGYARMMLGWSPPFLRNGVLRFKGKYRPYLSPVPRRDRRALFMPAFSSEVACQALLRRPVLEMDDRELAVTCFIADRESVNRMVREVAEEIKYFTGISAIKAVLIGGNNQPQLVYRRQLRS